MAIITTGNNFGATDAVTSTKLNNIANAATFDDPVDDSTLELASGGSDDGKLRIKDSGVTAAKLATDALELAYPVGSVYMNASDSTNPATLLGFGTWTAFGAGRVLVGLDSTDPDFNVAEETGGAKEVTLTAAQSGLPPHTHTHTAATKGPNAKGVGSGQSPPTAVARQDENTSSATADASEAHTNLQPYIVVYMWKRTV